MTGMLCVANCDSKILIMKCPMRVTVRIRIRVLTINCPLSRDGSALCCSFVC